MKFCSKCGASVRLLVPAGDHLPRHVCDACGAIHYQNPLLVVGCVPEHEGRILLCRRAIEPRRGYWTVPAGFMENGETLQEAAARESREEALAEVTIGSLLSVVHVLHAEQVHVFFRAALPGARYAAGAESLEVALVTPRVGEGESPSDWIKSVVAADAAAIYMAAGQAATIAAALIAAGKPPSTPVAIVESASLPESRRIFATLASLPRLTHRFSGPAVILVGPQYRARAQSPLNSTTEEASALTARPRAAGNTA